MGFVKVGSWRWLSCRDDTNYIKNNIYTHRIDLDKAGEDGYNGGIISDERVKDMNENEMLSEMQALRDEVKQLRDETKRLSREAKQMMRVTQMEYTLMPAEREKWVLDGIPPMPGYYAYYGGGGNSYVLYHAGSTKGEFDGYCAALEAAGFVRHQGGEVGKLFWASYADARAIVYVYYASCDGVLRAVVEGRRESELPPLAPICDGVPGSVSPKLVLFGDHLYDEYDCGMGYIFRLNDGTFVVIDGGMLKPDALVESFWGHLRALAGEGEIVISAWIFTHAHPDHTRVFVRLSELYAGQFSVRRVIHNFPGRLMCLGGGHQRWPEYEIGQVELAMARFDEKPVFIRAHTGQRFDFPGLSVDMLFTLDDFKQPYFPENFNATSLVFRVTAEGQTFMFLGDSEPVPFGILLERFGDSLRSDVVQVAHHGYYGGTKEIYDAVAAPIVLWPAPLFHPAPEKNRAPRLLDPAWSPVTRAMVRDHARAVYVAWKGSDVLDLPLTGEQGVTLAREDDPTI